jgi:hypothetical protein
MCEALQTTREELAFTAFERLFRERGLPLADLTHPASATAAAARNSTRNILIHPVNCGAFAIAARQKLGGGPLRQPEGANA